jgi:hypothetical protein
VCSRNLKVTASWIANRTVSATGDAETQNAEKSPPSSILNVAKDAMAPASTGSDGHKDAKFTANRLSDIWKTPQTAPLRKMLQRELVLARARMVLWKAVMERDDSIDFSIRMMEAKIGLREAEIRWLLEERRQDVLDRLESFE